MSKAAQERYDRENTIRVTLKLNKKTDAVIIKFLETQTSKQGSLKKILREVLKNT